MVLLLLLRRDHHLLTLLLGAACIHKHMDEHGVRERIFELPVPVDVSDQLLDFAAGAPMSITTNADVLQRGTFTLTST